MNLQSMGSHCMLYLVFVIPGVFLSPLHGMSPSSNGIIGTAHIKEVLLGIFNEMQHPTLQILYDSQHEDAIALKEIFQGSSSGLVLYQYNRLLETLQEMLTMSATQSTTLLLVLCTSPDVLAIFHMIKRERLESHPAHWLLMTSQEEATEDLLLGLEGLVLEGTRVSLLFRHSDGVFSLFTSGVSDDGVVRLSPRGTWKAKNQVLGDVRTIPDFKLSVFPDDRPYEDMRGRELRVASNDIEGFFILDETWRENSEVGYEGRQRIIGIDGGILRALSVNLNFTYRIVRPADGYWGSPLPNGTVTGVIGMSARREVAFSLCSIGITFLRDTVVDYSHPYVIEPLALFSRSLRRKNNLLAVLSPFHMEVWLSLLGTTLAIGPVLFLQSKLSRYLMAEREEWSLQQVSFNMFRVLVIQGCKLDVCRWFYRFTFLSWYLFCLIVSALYNGMLTSVLAIPEYEKPIDYLVDLPRAVENGLTVGLLRESGTEALFRTAESGIYRDTWLLLDHENPDESFVHSIEMGIRKAMEGKFVFIGYKITNELLVFKLGRSKFYVGRQEIQPFLIGIAFPPGAPYKDIFNRKLLRLVEGGLIAKWRADEFTRVSLGAPADSEASAKTYAIGLVHIQAALYMYVIGLLASSLVLILERSLPMCS